MLGFFFIFLSPSFNWKDLFGWDLDGNGRQLLLGRVNRDLPRGKVAAGGKEPVEHQEHWGGSGKE